jgi:hypothetical protein|tara:strand:+ start:1429 stop:1629 length:201 start_codon:yes stop_codon:yes gene_type:complete
MKPLIKKILREQWDYQPDKWDLLADDLKECIEDIIVKHKSQWNDDQYAVIGALESIMEQMFAKVER